MKKLTSMMIILLLVGCSKPTGEQALPLKSDEPIIVEPIEQVGYIEEFDEFDFTGEREATIDDRHFLIEDNPDNVVETLVYEYYYYNFNTSWDKLKEISAKENEALQISATNSEELFNEGCYLREIVLHSFDTLSFEDLKDVDLMFFSHFEEAVEKYNLNMYSVVEVEYSMAHSIASLDRRPQFGDGKYERYYLCGKANDEDSWQIFEIFLY